MTDEELRVKAIELALFYQKNKLNTQDVPEAMVIDSAKAFMEFIKPKDSTSVISSSKKMEPTISKEYTLILLQSIGVTSIKEIQKKYAKLGISIAVSKIGKYINELMEDDLIYQINPEATRDRKFKSK